MVDDISINGPLIWPKGMIPLIQGKAPRSIQMKPLGPYWLQPVPQIYIEFDEIYIGLYLRFLLKIAESFYLNIFEIINWL